MVLDSWFCDFWRNSRRHDASEEVLVGVLAFEVASLMSKLVHMWWSLSDEKFTRLIEEITDSVGIKKLVLDDDDYIAGLICAETIENMDCMVKSVARLAKRCKDPNLRNFEVLFGEWMKVGADPYGWAFSSKKMDKEVEEMKWIILYNASLYEEMEFLTGLERTPGSMRNDVGEQDNLIEFQKRVACRQRMVKHLQDCSPWNRTYDYVVGLFIRSLFTIFGRIKQLFRVTQTIDVDKSVFADSDSIDLSRAVSALIESWVHSFSFGLLGQFIGSICKTIKASSIRRVALLRNSITKSGLISGKDKRIHFYSGPLGKMSIKSGLISGSDKSSKKKWWAYVQSLFDHGKKPQPSRFLPQHDLLKVPPETLGAAALALHYAKVIIVIEKLVASPHLIDQDARDDLYNMLPASVRSALRAKLKSYEKSSLSLAGYNTTAPAGGWTDAMTSILEWLAPLAHNMIRWEYERSVKPEMFIWRSNVLLVQTLYFADLEKTKGAITELLVGLNYVSKSGREVDTKALPE